MYRYLENMPRRECEYSFKKIVVPYHEYAFPEIVPINMRAVVVGR